VGGTKKAFFQKLSISTWIHGKALSYPLKEGSRTVARTFVQIIWSNYSKHTWILWDTLPYPLKGEYIDPSQVFLTYKLSCRKILILILKVYHHKRITERVSACLQQPNPANHVGLHSFCYLALLALLPLHNYITSFPRLNPSIVYSPCSLE